MLSKEEFTTAIQILKRERNSTTYTSLIYSLAIELLEINMGIKPENPGEDSILTWWIFETKFGKLKSMNNNIDTAEKLYDAILEELNGKSNH